jgi:hypothetical protein
MGEKRKRTIAWHRNDQTGSTALTGKYVIEKVKNSGRVLRPQRGNIVHVLDGGKVRWSCDPKPVSVFGLWWLQELSLRSIGNVRPIQTHPIQPQVTVLLRDGVPVSDHRGSRWVGHPQNFFVGEVMFQRSKQNHVRVQKHDYVIPVLPWDGCRTGCRLWLNSQNLFQKVADAIPAAIGRCSV